MSVIPGMIRVMAASPHVHLCAPDANAREIAALLEIADQNGVSLCVFPELCLTGSTCGDLFAQDALLQSALQALDTLLALPVRTAFVLSLPLEAQGRIYACHAAVCGGRLLGLVPFDPSDVQLRAIFAPAHTAPASIPIHSSAPACGRLRFFCEDFDFAIGSASDALIGALPAAPAAYMGSLSSRRLQWAAQSAQKRSAIVCACAGWGESTTDHVFSGDACIYETGTLLSENTRFARESTYALADIDAARLRYLRRTGCAPYASAEAQSVLCPRFSVQPSRDERLLRPLVTQPFVPQEDALLHEALMLQSQALLRRMEQIHTRKAVLGVSGGLDSTLALLAAAYAYERAGWNKKNLIGITMPGFGTGSRTRSNADRLMALIGCTALTIPIGAAVMQHFEDIGQSPAVHDICYENAQARERTQIVMDYANKIGALALGTGDLSELALGWCTYNGDQMSMYNLNGSVPKTLMRSLVRCAAQQLGEDVLTVAQDIINTPVSPELIPSAEGELGQRTEDTLGAYELHDFFLYHMMDSGASPSKLFALSCIAFDGQYDKATIHAALTVFVRRFFTQQFKRSAMPDGPQISSVSLSPRDGWRMPSDAQMTLLMQEVDALLRD